jgi:protein-S-isoprenylcysteine O-methyltransferase Ste14
MEKQANTKHHENRDDLTGEHAFTDIGQIILLIVFLAVWIIDSFVLGYSTFIAGYIPLLIRIIIAAVILCLGAYLGQQAHKIVFKEVREVPGVIRKGVFNRVRHPMYLGAILFFLGLLILTLSTACSVIWLIILAFYHYVSKYEENLLLQRFGKDYENYIKEVPMWVPKIKTE